jgi:hypothetical protein
MPTFRKIATSLVLLVLFLVVVCESGQGDIKHLNVLFCSS